MKDIVVRGKAVVREIWIFAACVLVALALNVYAIVRFRTSWSELLTTAPTTLALALLFYLALALLRGALRGVLHLARRPKARAAG